MIRLQKNHAGLKAHSHEPEIVNETCNDDQWSDVGPHCCSKHGHCGCILPTNVVDIAIRCINIRSAQNTTQTLIGGELKTTPAFINISV